MTHKRSKRGCSLTLSGHSASLRRLFAPFTILTRILSAMGIYSQQWPTRLLVSYDTEKHESNCRRLIHHCAVRQQRRRGQTKDRR